MSMQIFNQISANLRQQFPTLSDAMILQKTSEIYQAMLTASTEALKLQAKNQRRLTPEQQTETIRHMREVQNETAKRNGWGLFGGGK